MLGIEVFVPKYDFCISGPMNAHLSVHGSLKRAKRRNSGPVRLQVRLSILVSKLHAYRHA